LDIERDGKRGKGVKNLRIPSHEKHVRRSGGRTQSFGIVNSEPIGRKGRENTRNNSFHGLKYLCLGKQDPSLDVKDS